MLNIHMANINPFLNIKLTKYRVVRTFKEEQCGFRERRGCGSNLCGKQVMLEVFRNKQGSIFGFYGFAEGA